MVKLYPFLKKLIESGPDEQLKSQRLSEADKPKLPFHQRLLRHTTAKIGISV